MGTASNFTIVSFATNDHYREYGERLIGQCEALGLDHRVEFFEPWAEKRETCLYRPEYMLDVMDDRPLVWFDADGDILEVFDIPERPAGFVDNPWGDERNPVTAGIFMVRPEGRALLEAWRNTCAEWSPGEIGSHRRLCWVRDVVVSADMTPFVRGKIVLRGAAGKDERSV